MLDTKIILVEGIPGSGKSGISQFVCRQLNVVGQTAFWCHEERADHPLSLFYDPQRHKSWDGYIEEAVRQWQSFVEVLYEKDQIAVLDAALLQNHLRSMLIFNSDRQAMFDLVSRVEGSIAGLNPVFIYLRPKDIENHFRDIVALRGERMLELWIAAHDQYPSRKH